MRGLLQGSSQDLNKKFRHEIHGPRVVPILDKEERELLRKWEIGEYIFPPLLVERFDLAVVMAPQEDQQVKDNIRLWRLIDASNVSQVSVSYVSLEPREREANLTAIRLIDRNYETHINARRNGMRARVVDTETDRLPFTIGENVAHDGEEV